MTEVVQRTLTEARANEYPHLGGGITLGSILEHTNSGAWVLVLDIRDDGRIRFLNLEEVPDDDIVLLESATGCVEHARIGRAIANRVEGCEYHGPPEKFRVLGPTHPDYQRQQRSGGVE